MWWLLVTTILVITKIIGYLLLLILALIIGYRIWWEPVKGVCTCKTMLHGKVVLITGGNSGIGLETAKYLAKRGANIIIASRHDKKSEKAVAIIKATSGNNNVEYRQLDLANNESIIRFVEKFNEDYDRLDVLVNNAGSGAVKPANLENGPDLLMQINYVGPFLLTHLLLPKLIKSTPSRIVIVSSNAHIIASKFKVEDITKLWKETTFTRYAYTKLCNILWTKELAKRLPCGVTANALHPGIVVTNIFNVLPPVLRRIILVLTFLIFKTASEGAQTTIHLCVSQILEKSTGGYYLDCKKTNPAKIAENDELAKQVWDSTVDILKL